VDEERKQAASKPLFSSSVTRSSCHLLRWRRLTDEQIYIILIPLNCNLYIQKEKNGRSFEKLLPFKKSIKII